MQSRGSGRSPEEIVVVTINRFAPHPKWAVTALLPLRLFVTATKAQQLGSSSSHSLRSILWSSINKQLFRGQWAVAQVLRAVLFVRKANFHCLKMHVFFSWVYVLLLSYPAKVNRIYFFLLLRLLSASLVTLDTPQLTNPICEHNLEGVIKKPKPCPGCVYIGDASFCSVESNTVNLV